MRHTEANEEVDDVGELCDAEESVSGRVVLSGTGLLVTSAMLTSNRRVGIEGSNILEGVLKRSVLVSPMSEESE